MMEAVRTSETSVHFSVNTRLFKEIIVVCSENHAKPINTKCSITDSQSRWFIYLPLDLKGLNIYDDFDEARDIG
jgi:hypothetical protein